MIIKKYVVKNMNEAMTRIRYELGKDAIIISQRKIRQSGFKKYFSPKLIEVTAALENTTEPMKTQKPQSTFASSDVLKESVESIKAIMNKDVVKSKEEEKNVLEDEVKEMKSILNEILNNTKGEDNEDLLLNYVNSLDLNPVYLEEFRRVWNEAEDKEEAMKSYLSEVVQISNEDINGRVVLVGPTGVGKTTTIAKLAGKLALMDKKKVGLITIDTYRIGAVEQLKTYAEIMNIPFRVVITIKEMEEAINSMTDLDVVLTKM